jgi:hypothetical protein
LSTEQRRNRLLAAAIDSARVYSDHGYARPEIARADRDNASDPNAGSGRCIGSRRVAGLAVKSGASTGAPRALPSRILDRASFERLPADLRQYFEDLKRSYRLAATRVPGPIPDVTQELLVVPEADARWSDIFALEIAYASVLPDEEVPGHFALCRDRLRQIVGIQAYNAYLETKPQDPADPAASIPRMRADLIALLDRLNYIYTATPSKDRIRNRLSFWLSVITVIAAGAISLQLRATLRSQDVTHASHTLLIAALAGLLGGFISVQQRLQTNTDVDPLFKRLEMSSGFWNIILVSPISGGIFAVVLYAMFAAGVVTGAIFPAIYAGPGPDAMTHVMDLRTFLRSAGPASGADLAKLIVWSFVAGFAERFVPDVLTRLATVDAGPPAKG